MAARAPHCCRLVDIAVNLTDCVFRGINWKGKRIHEDDFSYVIRRAKDAGVCKILISGTSLEVSKRAVELCKTEPGFLYCTVGVHPAHCNDFLPPPLVTATETTLSSSRSRKKKKKNKKNGSGDNAINTTTGNGDSPTPSTPQSPPEASSGSPSPSTPLSSPQRQEEAPQALHPTAEEVAEYTGAQLQILKGLVKENPDCVVALGEIGLDYAEESLCPRDIQKEFFLKQLQLSREVQLPLFLHSRDCGLDFAELLTQHQDCVPCGGVVHSFNGSAEELQLLRELNLHIGVNGSSFRDEEAARRIAETVPVDCLHLETDAPWCDIRPAHFAHQYVKTSFEERPKEGFEMGKCVVRRNEPCHLRQVLEVVYGVMREDGRLPQLKERGEGGKVEEGTGRDVTIEELSEIISDNSLKLFPGMHSDSTGNLREPRR